LIAIGRPCFAANAWISAGPWTGPGVPATSGAPVGAGVTLDVDLRAERWLPDPNPRFRPNDASRLYVWRAQLTAPIRSATVAAGRVLPVGIPGATLFDGASAALRLGRGEVGVFGGLVPEPDTTAPTTDRATGGAFWSVEKPLSKGAFLRHDGRLAVVQSPELGTRGEGTLAAGLFSRAVIQSASCASLGSRRTSGWPALTMSVSSASTASTVPPTCGVICTTGACT